MKQVQLSFLLVCLGVAASVSPIAAQTISSAANQTYGVAQAPAGISPITVQDAAPPKITAANDLRIRIPSGLNMTWNTALTTATITGGAAGKVSTTVSYEDAGKTLVINVTTSFSGNDQIVAATISSAANQTFVVGQAATAISAITVTDAATALITAANDIRIRIPASFIMTWNTAITTATITGTGATKVSTTVSYEDAGKTLVVNVTSNFAGADQIVVSGPQYSGFTAPSASDRLQLVLSGSGGGTNATDARTIQTVQPAIVSAANQVFFVGQAPRTISAITVSDAATPGITATRDIRIRIPASFNMSWNTGVSTATITGTGASKVSTTVSYEDGGKTLRLDVTTSFLANDQIVVSGLQYTSFTAPSAPDYLQLVASGLGGGTTSSDSRTIQIITAPIMASAANQSFVVGQAATPLSAITVTDAATPAITAAQDIRIRIPATFNMSWNTALTTATLTGSGAGNVSTAVSYEDAGKTLVLNVTGDFAGNDQITVSGLEYTGFTAPSTSDYLQLVVTGAGAGTAALDSRTIQIVAPTMASAANQTFVVGQAATGASAITVADAGVPAITAAQDLRIRIPATFNMTWNTGLTTATITGSAAGKVATAVSYEDGGKTLVLDVTTDFAGADQIIVSGLAYTSFTAPSAVDNLELVVSGAGGGTAAGDSRTIQVVAPTLASAANQTFVVGQAATAMSAITITDATTPSITAAQDIRVRIPATSNLTWNTALTTATLTGTGATKVATTVSYEDGGKTLVLNVTTNFAGGNQIVVSGLQYTSFTAPSPAASLQLVVTGAGGSTNASDTRTIQIVAPTLASAANQLFVVGQASTGISAITVTDAATPTITTTNDIRIRIPASFNMSWNTALTTATLTGTGASKVS